MKWKCSVCGYIHDGDNPPAHCPKCEAPKEKFEQLDEKESNLVERSRKTNLFHNRVIALAGEIAEICTRGIEDNLDPGCVDVFRKSGEMAKTQMKLSMTEVQGHMGKGKWG